MHDEVAAKLIAAIIGLCAFAIAIVVGLMVDNPADVILVRAVVAMLACSIVGFIIGMISTHQLSSIIINSADQAKAAAAELEDVVSKAALDASKLQTTDAGDVEIIESANTR